MNRHTRITRICLLACSLAFQHVQAQAASGMISYQGVITTNGQRFDGTGYFKFTLIDAAGQFAYWQHDASPPNKSSIEPATALALDVDDGLFMVLLGDTSVANMVGLPVTVFTTANLHLRIWFSEDDTTFTQLSPDQPLGMVGYAAHAAQVPNGAIAASQLASSAVTSVKIANHAVTSNKLDWSTMPVMPSMRGYAENGPFDTPPVASGVNSIALGVQAEASGLTSTVGGGIANRATVTRATVGGGSFNRAEGVQSTVAGGHENIAKGENATAGGGVANLLDSNAKNSIIGGGFVNTIYGSDSTIGGGHRNFARHQGSTISGGISNRVDHGASVLGGRQNQATNTLATIGGGAENRASGTHATVGGGYQNRATGAHATIGGGDQNQAINLFATVGGGAENRAGSVNAGSYSTVPGGFQNVAAGHYSFAAGNRAKASQDGSFVWADATDADMTDQIPNSVTFRASGGYRLFSNGAATIGAALEANATSWSTLSDRAAKENFEAVDTAEILEKLARLPLTAWNYKADPDQRRYIGPVAQDFHAAFGLGNDTTINTLDMDGVLLAAIQALVEDNQRLRARLDAIEARLRE